MARRKAVSFKLEKIIVRMYRPGLGDCFLLTFVGKEGSVEAERHMLIDCGVLQGTANEADRLRKVIEDVRKRTNGKLAVLAVTHEHADHLSGFNYHPDLFSQDFQIDQVWLGWTEDKEDPEVKEMYSTVRKVPIQVLEKALEELQKAKSPNYPYYKQLTQFLKDNGMEAVKGIAKAQNREPLYLSPNPDRDGPTKVITREDFGGVRFHVLGPPVDPKHLKRSDPPKTRSQVEHGAALNQATAFSAAVLNLAVDGWKDDSGLSVEDIKELFELSLPFDLSQGFPLTSLFPDPNKPHTEQPHAPEETQKFIRKNYYSQGMKENTDWRRIDADWLESASSLALYLDGDINNTSLVLGIELGEGGKVLLFAGDAQYGNWISWAKTKRGEELLKRTVLYKVGHHGSHNATLKNGGLSLMGTAPGFEELVAMIPVDTEKAKTKRWRMPEHELKEMLVKQTHGRIIMACEGLGGDGCHDFAYKKPSHPPSGARISLMDWKKFLADIKMDKDEDFLWVEYSIPV